MQYIKTEDYEYIMQKYADEPKSIVCRNRFVRQDRIFDPATGINGDDIIKNILYMLYAYPYNVPPCSPMMS